MLMGIAGFEAWPHTAFMFEPAFLFHHDLFLTNVRAWQLLP